MHKLGQLNGAEPLDRASQACVELLESVLADAKLGNVTSCAIVACGDESFGVAMAGPDAARLNLGLDSAKMQIMQMVTQPQPRRASMIIQPGKVR